MSLGSPHGRHHPSPAETAATLLCGLGAARVGPDHGEVTSPVLHGLTRGGEVVLVLAGHDVATLGLDRCHVTTARLDVSAAAPVPDVHLPRAELSAIGQVRILSAHRSRTALLAGHSLGPDLRAAAEEWTGSVVALFSPDQIRVHAHGVCAPVERVSRDFVDALAADEIELVHQFDRSFGADLLPLVRSLEGAPENLGDVTRVRVVGVDRYGVNLLAVGGKPGPVGLRLPFAAPVQNEDEALRMMVVAVVGMRGCLHGECRRCAE